MRCDVGYTGAAKGRLSVRCQRRSSLVCLWLSVSDVFPLSSPPWSEKMDRPPQGYGLRSWLISSWRTLSLL